MQVTAHMVAVGEPLVALTQLMCAHITYMCLHCLSLLTQLSCGACLTGTDDSETGQK